MHIGVRSLLGFLTMISIGLAIAAVVHIAARHHNSDPGGLIP
jgi:hypothetical protein